MKGFVPLVLGIFGTFAFSWVGLILIPNLQIGHLDPQMDEEGTDVYPAPTSGMADRGRKIYAANGCVYCHSQQVRADYAASDIDRKWGERRSAPRDYIFARPVLLGKMRMGPDLSNIGKRAPAEEKNPSPSPSASPAGSPAPAASPAKAVPAASPAPSASSPAPAASPPPKPANSPAASASPAAAASASPAPATSAPPAGANQASPAKAAAPAASPANPSASPATAASPPPKPANSPAASASPAAAATSPAASPAPAESSPPAAGANPVPATQAASVAAPPSGSPAGVKPRPGEPAAYSAAWHHRHLYSPRSISIDSDMPAYRFLYEKRRIAGERSAEALELTGSNAPPTGWEIVPTYDAQCLVAYLMSLDQSHPLKEVKGVAPAASPAPAASGAPTAAAPSPVASPAKGGQ